MNDDQALSFLYLFGILSRNEEKRAIKLPSIDTTRYLI